MELTLSTHLLVYGRLQLEVLDCLQEAGLARLEVWLAEPHVPWRDARRLAGLREQLADRGLAAGSVHLPFYPSVPDLREHGRKWSTIHPDPAERRRAIEGAAEGLRAAAALGASCGVLHLGWQGDAWGPCEEESAREAVAALLPVARECRVDLLLENIISAGTRSRKLVALLDELDPGGRAGVCLDLGHAHVEGDALRQLEDALPRLRHLHLHDNDGRADTHLAPGRGTLPWGGVLKRLREARFRGQAALEIRDPSRGSEDPRAVLERELAEVNRFRERWWAGGSVSPASVDAG